MKYRPIILFESHKEKQEIDFKVLNDFNYTIKHISEADWVGIPN